MAQYILSLFVSLGGVTGVTLLCWVFFGVFDFWRDNLFLAFFLYWCADYVLLLFVLCVAAAWFGCSVYFIRRPLAFLDELVEAAGQMTLPDSEPVALSPELSGVQEQLNLALDRARWNAYAAREAEQRKNDLIVYLAHDLKTPLTSVIGYLTLLRDEQELSPALRARYTGVALDKAERLEDLINEFFDITRFNLTHLELELAPVDIVRMLQQVAGEFAPMLEESGLTCRLDLPEKLTYPCDADKLARVFDNLLRNACHYSTAGTAVVVSAAAGEEEIVLTFTNTGITIPEEKLGRIFEQFFRLDASRAAHTGGAGLGLAIAREIVELHGGTISAKSARGITTFTVSLPLS